MTTVFDERLEQEIPGSVPVYALGPPDPSAIAGEVLERVGPRLGLDKPGEARRQPPDWLALNEGPLVLQVHRRSGAVRYQNTDKHGLPGSRPFDLPDDRSVALAEELVRGLPADDGDDVAIEGLTHLRVAGGSVTDPSDRVEQVVDAGVVFGRRVEGVAVEGPGAFGMVNIDADGEVVAFRRVWRRRARQVADVRIADPEAVLAQAQKRFDSEPGDVVVTRARFGYFEQHHAHAQQFLQPAYAFVYEVHTGQLGYKRILVFAAGGEEMEPLRGKKRFATESQPVRRPKPARAARS